MTNLIEAICNIAEREAINVSDVSNNNNRANLMGDALENYIKNAFANTFGVVDEEKRKQEFDKLFSYLGSRNHPPDLILNGGAAIEVKKIESASTELQLNSSHPKALLSSDNPMLTDACRNCESWDYKDLIYCVGHVKRQRLKSLWMVYGNIYSAEQKRYNDIRNSIISGIRGAGIEDLSETTEIGRVNKVDPLKISSLRIRGMWLIQNPRKVFEYIHETGAGNNFELISIIPLDKWNDFPEVSIKRLYGLNNDMISVNDAEVKDPNNPTSFIKVKVVKFILI